MIKIWLYLIVSFVYSTEYYVSTTGDSLNIGTFNSPFLYILQAANIMQAGDICYIRQGVYHEEVTLDNQDGSSINPKSQSEIMNLKRLKR